MKSIIFIKQKIEILPGGKLQGKLELMKGCERTFTLRVSDRTKDSMRSSRLFVLKSEIPVRPQSTLARTTISASIRSNHCVSNHGITCIYTLVN